MTLQCDNPYYTTRVAYGKWSCILTDFPYSFFTEGGCVCNKCFSLNFLGHKKISNHIFINSNLFVNFIKKKRKKFQHSGYACVLKTGEQYQHAITLLESIIFSYFKFGSNIKGWIFPSYSTLVQESTLNIVWFAVKPQYCVLYRWKVYSPNYFFYCFYREKVDVQV